MVLSTYEIIPVYSGASVTLTLPSSYTDILSAKVVGEVLTKVYSTSVNLGEYYFEDGTLIISPSINASGLSVVIEYTESTTTLSTGGSLELLEWTSYPSFLSNVNAIGQLQISRTFQGSPSASLTIIDDVSKKSSILSFFPEDKLFNIRNVSLRCTKPQIEIDLLTNKMTVNLSFQGYWDSYGESTDHPMDKPISVESITINLSDKYYYTPSKVCSAAGVSFTGSGQKIYIDNPTDNNSSITARSILSDDRFYPEGKILDWEKQQVKLRNWYGMPTLSINKHLPVINQGGTFKSKLSNAVFTIDESSEETGDVYNVIFTGRSDYSNPPLTGYSFDVNNLRSASWCFDNIADKTIVKWTYQLNGTDTSTVEEEWGFVYTNLDTHTLTTINGETQYIFNPSFVINPSSLWKKIRTTVKVFNYDTKNGKYLKSVTGYSIQKTRLLQESDKETLDLGLYLAEESDPSVIAQINKQLEGYTKFFDTKFYINETYVLGDLGNFYPDMKKPSNASAEFIPSYYPQKYVKSEGITQVYPDPRSTEDDPQPDIVVGNYQKEIQETIVTSTNPEKFKTITETVTAEKTNLTQSASSVSQQDNTGRPSTAPNITIFGKSVPKTTTSENIKYLISTDGASFGNDIENGSISYPDTTTLAETKKGVKTEYSIKNSQNESTLTLTSKTLYTVIMGQRISYNGQIYRLFGYTETFDIKGGKVYIDSVELSLGLEQSVSVSNVKVSGSGSSGSISSSI